MLQKDVRKMNLEIEASSKRLFALRQAQKHQAPSERIVLAEALHEVEATLEELRVVEEELRQQNEELAEARTVIEAERQHYRYLFEFAPHGYLVTDALGVILEANRAAAVMLNVEQKHLKRKPLAVYFSSSDKSAFYQALNDLKNGAERIDLKTRLTPRGGGAFAAAITGTSGSASFLDVTYLWVIQSIAERAAKPEDVAVNPETN